MRRQATRTSGADFDHSSDADGGRKGFIGAIRSIFGPKFVPPQASRLSRKSGWLEDARAKSDALEAKLRKADGGPER